MTDILVQMQVVQKYNHEFHTQGLDHFSTKKEFLNQCGEIWDIIKQYPEMKATLSLTNMEEF